jgi:hypothetical protein
MKSDATHSSLALLVRILDQGYERKAWHGPNLRQSLRGVTAKQAAWRPQRGRHNIWEIAVHAAYWKYIVRRRLRGSKRGSFALKGSNWFRRPSSLNDKAWREDRELLEREHRKLCEAVTGAFRGRKRSLPLDMIFGVAFHDVYHAAQIRLLRRLQEKPQA